MAEAMMSRIESAPEPLDLSVLIVTWNSERWIERCLKSLPGACRGLRYETIIFDNASSDATLRHVPEDGSRVFRSPKNEGFAAGTNRAFRESSGRHVFLLNPDCELDPGALTTLCAFLDEHPEAAGAAPLLVDDSGGSQRYFQLRRLPTLRGLATEALLLNKLFPKNRATAHYRYRDLDLESTTPQRVEQPAAAALLIRRKVFEEVGAFDERFSPAWFEDVDYCRRLSDAGKEIFVVPAAVARHHGGASLEHMTYRRFIELWYRNMWLYARKWFSRGEAESLRWAIIVGMVMRFAAAIFGARNGFKSRGDALRSYVAVLRSALNRWENG
jgi:N-acetylglucosaminyl-diphospho-decaprenol L-rhamnosyltransferase